MTRPELLEAARRHLAKVVGRYGAGSLQARQAERAVESIEAIPR